MTTPSQTPQGQSLGETPFAAPGGPAEEASGVVSQDAAAESAAAVSLETHRRLLSEKKKLQERLVAIESEAKAKQESELKAQNQYKSLYEQAQKEKEDLANRVSENDQRWNNAIKLDSFMAAMGPRKIDPKYAGFINLENIVYDTDSGAVDPSTVQREVERVCKEYPEVVRGAVQAKGLPGVSPTQSNLQSMSSNKGKVDLKNFRDISKFL